MAWSKRSNATLFLWFFLFLHAGSFLVRNVNSVVAQGSWSSWGRWSTCGARNADRETRFRNCVDSDGNYQRSSKCVGHVRRTRQCATCHYPLLNRGHNDATRNSRHFTIVHSAGLSPTGNAWCLTTQSATNQYLEIAFKHFVRFTGISTRGYDGRYRNGYITRYKVQFSYNGGKWFPLYTSKGEDVVFNGTMNLDQVRNFETAFVARYVRIYPVKYESDLCVDVELYGCEFNCGGLITNNMLRINTPDSAAQLEEPNCLWRIESTEATKLQLLFPYFKLRCKEGFLKILDGSSPFVDGQTFELLCGESRNVRPLEFMGRELWLHYRGYPATDIGFRVQGNVYTIKTLKSSSGEIQVPDTGDVFKHVFRYTWVVMGSANASILLTIQNFESDNIRRVNGKCVADSIIIHNGTDIKKSLVARLCDDKFPRTIHVQTNYVRIKYRAGSTKPRWKLHFSYKIIPVTTVAPTPHDTMLSTSPGNEDGNGTDLVVDAVGRANNAENSDSNVPVIISSILAVVIVAVFLVALVHFLRKRKQFLRKHPYDCSNRPVSHFGDEDSTPFINQNVLMWNDSGSRKSDKEKPKKNSLPHVTVSLRSQDDPQRLSIIPAEMLSEAPSDCPQPEQPASLVVSDAFTEECLQLLSNNFTPDSDNTPNRESTMVGDTAEERGDREDSVQSDTESVKSDVESVQSETESVKSDVESVQSETESVKSDVEGLKSDSESVHIEDSHHDYEDIFEENTDSSEKKPEMSLDMPSGIPLTTPEIEKYLAWGAL